MNKIFVSGYFGFGNTGDEVILDAIISQLASVAAPADFTVMSGNPAETTRSHHVNAVLWSDTAGMEAAIAETCLVIIGGGGLFHDYHGFDPNNCLLENQWGISYYTAPAVLGAIHNKPVMLYGVGIGPLFSEAGRAMTRLVCALASAITVRDQDSARLLAEIGVDASRIQVTADPAFTFNPPPRAKRLPGPPVLGVSVRNWDLAVAPAFWERELAEALDLFIGGTAATIVFYPLQSHPGEREDDTAASERVRAHMQYKHATSMAPAGLSASDVFTAISSSDLVLGMRLHAFLSAVIHSVPAVALVYDPKVASLANSLGLDDAVVELAAIQAPTLSEKLKRALERGESFPSRIEPQLQTARQAAMRNSEIAIEILRNPSLPEVGLNPDLRDLLSRAIRNYLVHGRDFRKQIEILSYQLSLKEQEIAADHARRSAKEDAFDGRVTALTREKDLLSAELQSTQAETQTVKIQLEASRQEAHLALTALREQRLRADREIQLLHDQLQAAEELLDAFAKTSEQERNLHAKRLQATRRRLHEAKLDFASYQKDKESWIADLKAHHDTREREFADYRADKEAYIAALRQKLDRPFRHLFSSVFGRSGRALTSLPARLIPGSLQRYWNLYQTPLLTLRRAAPAEVYPGNVPTPDHWKKPVSLISTMFNEQRGLPAWLASIERQSRQPDEIVIVDAGSNDRTVSILEEFAARQSYPVRVLVQPGANISAGRNLAIRSATHSVIACTDAGCMPDDRWLEQITRPFEDETPDTNAVEVVAGWTDPVQASGFTRLVSELFIAQRSSVHLESYLPSSRTIAFSRAAWLSVGGYPEWLTRWAEDTWFAIQLRNRCRRWVVQPAAIVHWGVRDSWKATLLQSYRYGFGDGETGIAAGNYAHDVRLLSRALTMLICAAVGAFALLLFTPAVWRFHAAILLAALFLVALINRARSADSVYGGTGKGILRPLRKAVILYSVFVARNLGYVAGLRARPAAALRRMAELQGCAIIFSGVPIDDSGGGQRATQIALELLARRFRVVFLNQYPRQESANLGIRIEHPDLTLAFAGDFDAREFMSTVPRSMKTFAIAEFPHPAFLKNLGTLKAAGVPLIYDLIDNWRSSLGGDWYSLPVEEEYLAICDHVIASAKPLVKWLQSIGEREIHYVPNAVNTRIFSGRGGTRNAARPADMPAGEYTIIYVGALWGHWFDWDLLIAMAREHRTASVVVIGDYRGECAVNLPNLHFLGLKPQAALPAYLQHADVAIVPFIPSQVIEAVSPLKVFEYLSMGLPVVSTRIPEIEDLPYVTISDSQAAFIASIDSARSYAVDPAVIERFRNDHCWAARVDKILEITFGGERVRFHAVGSHE